MKFTLRLLSDKLSILGLLSVVVVSSCTTTKTWSYSPGNWEPRNKMPYQIAVKPYRDKRPNNNRNAYYMYLLPVCPYGWMNYEIPENGYYTTIPNHKPTEDYSQALVDEIIASGQYKNAFKSGETDKSEYYIEGQILSTRMNYRVFSYGLSVFGPALSLFGAPTYSYINEIKLKVDYFSSKDNKLLLSKEYYATTKRKRSNIFYYNTYGYEYPTLLKEINTSIINDLGNLTSNNSNK